MNNREYPGDGILLIDKDEGSTSYEVVKGVKRILGVKKVGHAGTLDPFATGLLIILIGQGTKLSPYLMAGKKRYLAVIRLPVLVHIFFIHMGGYYPAHKHIMGFK